MAEYFQHDFYCRNHPKMVALIGDHGAFGYGIFWAIAEYTHEIESNSIRFPYEYSAIAKQMGTGVEQVLNIVEDCISKYNLLSRNDVTGEVFSKRTIENFVKRNEIKESKSRAGKASAEAKKAKLAELDQQNSTGVQQNSTGVQQNSTKESKVKETKEKEMKESKENEVPTHDFSDKTELFTKHMTLIHPKTKALVQTLVIANKHRDYDFLWEKSCEIWRSAEIEPNAITHYGYFCNLRELAVIAYADLKTRKELNAAIPGCTAFLKPKEGEYGWMKEIVPMGKKTGNTQKQEMPTHLPAAKFNG